MELPAFNFEDFNKWKSGVAHVKDCDMDDEMKNDAREHVATGVEKCQSAEGVDYMAASKLIKDAMDKQFGPNWHCIIGQGFSFEVTRMQNSTIMLYYAGNLAILLFKC